jgi:hypothetical protein
MAALALSACGSTGLSYSDGFSVGQNLAATAPHASIVGPRLAATCRHQWTVSGSVDDSRAPWVKGCIAGVRQIEASL